nr:hybrid sensor histidine kinase/response regulator [Paludibacter sp.]
MRKSLLLLAMLLTICGYAETYNFARLDNSRGLSNNQITSTFKDSRGFIWFGSNFGLNRYDGYNIKVYKSIKNDTTSLPFNAVSRIQEDATGNLWISSGTSYFMYDIQKERFIHTLSPFLSSIGINFTPTIVEIDQQKNYYFYSPSAGIYKYNVNTRQLKHFIQSGIGSTLSKGNISSIKFDKGHFWALFQNGLLERFSEKTNRVDFRNTYVMENARGAYLSKNLFVDANGCPWIYPGLVDKGALQYDFQKSQWVYFGNDKRDFRGPADQYIASNFVRDIKQDHSGKVWIAADHGGVNIYDKESAKITVLQNDPTNPSSLSQNSPISLYCDNTGIMWVGTYKNGVAYYHPGMFKFEKSPLYFYHNPDLETKDCNTLYEDRAGNLWIGTNGGGLLKREKSSQSFTLYRNQKENPSSISSDVVISMLQDKKGTMWIGTYLGGLNQMVGDRFINYIPDVNNPNWITNKSIYGMVEDAQQNIWLGTLGGGLNKLDPSRKKFSQLNVDSRSVDASASVLSMYTKNSNLVYLSTPIGIYILNTRSNSITPVFKSSEQLNRLSDLIIYNTIVDKRNQLWIATDNGINVYNPANKSITYINKINGLPSDQVVSLIEDNNGNVWAGTRNGLACIYCKRNSKTNQIRYSVASFDENDGLLSSIFNQNAIFKNKEGNIYLGCTKGYTVFNPKNIRFNHLVPQPRFTELLISNDVISPDVKYKNRIILHSSIALRKKIELNYDEKNFVVKFSAMSYIHPEKNRYRYKLV